MVYCCLALGVISLIAFLAKRDTNGSPIAAVLKTLTSVFFVLTAIAALIENGNFAENSIFGLLLIGGLVFGLIGDLTLDLKYVYKDDEALWTYTGMTSFSLGHVLFLAAIGLYFTINWLAFGIGIGITVLFMLMSIFVMKLDFNKYIINATIYCALLITFMVQAFTACLTDIVGFSGAPLLLFIGSALFFISDCILSMQYFGGKQSRFLVIANHVTYYGAQFCLAMSLLVL